MPKATGKLLLDRLADAMAAAAVPALLRPATPSADSPMELFSHGVDDALIRRGDDGGRLAYSVLRIWAPVPTSNAPNRESIQCATTGPDGASAFAQSERCFNSLLFPDSSPFAGRIRRGWAINGFTVSIFNLGRPALIRGDDQGVDVVFNFEAGYVPA